MHLKTGTNDKQNASENSLTRPNNWQSSTEFYIVPIQTPVPLRPSAGQNPDWSIKATFHLTISMRGQCAMGKIQRNNYHHRTCGPSLTGKTMSVFLIFRQRTHRNVKSRSVRSNNFYATKNTVD